MEAKKRITDTVAIRKIMIEKGFKTISSLAIEAGINRTFFITIIKYYYSYKIT